MFGFLRLIGPFLRPYRGAYFVGLLCVVVTNAVRMAVPELLGAGVETLQRLYVQGAEGPRFWRRWFEPFAATHPRPADGPRAAAWARFEALAREPEAGWADAVASLLPTLAWMIPALTLLYGLCLFLQRFVTIQTSRDVEYDLREALFAHLTRQSHSYFNRQRIGDLMSRLSSDVEVVRMALGPAIMYLGMVVTILPIVLVMEWRISPLLTVLSFAPMALIGVTVYLSSRAQYRYTVKIQEQMARLSGKARENFAGIRVLQSFAREEAETGAFAALSATYADHQIGFARVRAGMLVAIMALGDAAVIIIVGLAGVRWGVEALTLGDLTRFLAYQAILTWPMIALGWVMNLFARGQAGMERLRAVLDAPLEIEESAVAAPPVQGRIELRGLSFRYEEGRDWALHDVSLTIAAGATIGIVGPVGAGKSTLVSLIPRLFPVPRGQVLLDGRDLNDWPPAALRAAIGWVPQEAFLFADRVRRNIGFHAREVPLELVVEAARHAVVDGEVDGFPERYETRLGERGLTVSGGQKQRLTLARALAEDKQILIVDDALSSVDNETAEAILRRLRELRRGRTVLLIAHRMDLVRDADRIVVLEGGRLTEQGTHEELIARGGYYAALTRAQEAGRDGLGATGG